MGLPTSAVVFNRKTLTIIYDGKVIIDLSRVPNNCEAKLYSGVITDFVGMPTTFKVVDSKRPFYLGSHSLSPEGLVYALIENRLKIEGVSINEGVMEAYKYIIDKNQISRMLYTGRDPSNYKCS